jgi:Zn-dependent protease
MYPDENEQITSMVARILRIESVVWGDQNQQRYLADFKGRLISDDSEAAYDRLAERLRPLKITPLFRNIAGDHHVVLLRGVAEAKPSKLWVNIALFLVTLVSVFLTGMMYGFEGSFPTNLREAITIILERGGQGLAFSASLLGILLAHEFGHYLMARRHNTAATLPYFIPFPLSPFGTMGAVIVQKEAHRNKRILLDIGMAGPLAGLVIAIPVLLLGLSLSELGPIPAVFPSGHGILMEGNSILYLAAKYAVFGQWLPQPENFGDMSPLRYWIGYIFTGNPTPFGALDVRLHPVAFAGWAGLLVTALNLIPAGQLDGGHITHGLFGRGAALILPFVLVGLMFLGLAWPGWWLWAVLIFFMGRHHAEPLDQITPIDTRRKFMAVLCLVIFFLVFTPVPLMLISG